MGRSRSRSRSRERARDRSRSRSRDRRRRQVEGRRRSPEGRRRSPDGGQQRLRSPDGGRRERSRERRPRDRSRSRSRERRPRDGGYDRPREHSRERRQQGGMPPPPERRACFKCGEEGHLARDCPTAPAGGGGGRGPCYKCGEEGHIARECPNPEAAGAGGGRRGRRGRGDDGEADMAWGKPGEQDDEEEVPDKEPEPEFGLSGALAAETNKVNGVVLVHQEPAEARKPTARWRLYVFKNGEPFGDPLHIHRMSCYLFGRERRVADVPTDHPSCSKQHAVLQFRHTEKEGADGMMHGAVRPYVMDLGSTNGTYLNNERIEAERYYELLEQDLLRFGNSTREYVLLKEK